MTFAASDDFRASFFEECDELLEAMQDGFVCMVDGSSDAETIHVVFRAVHSIKGGAGAFGLNDLVGFAHEFETVLDHVRADRLPSTDEILLLFQQCGDYLTDLVAAARENGSADRARSEALLKRLDELSRTSRGPSADASRAAPDAEDFQPLALDLGDLDLPQDPPPSGWLISVKTDPELFTSGNEPLILFRALSRFGETKVLARTDDVPLLSACDPTLCNITWQIELHTETAEDVVLDAFDFVLDCAEITITPLRGSPEIGLTPLIAEPLSNPAMAEDEVAHVIEANQARSISAPVDKPVSLPPPATSQTIRVDFERVDKLINLVGELVIKEAMLAQAVEAIDLPRANDVLQELDGLKQLAGEIQEGVMAIRAQPIKPLFQRMARTIRDAGTLTGKTVRLVMKGESAEIDKTVLERLVDPLNHMVRNSVDHGLEAPELRVTAGKAAEGSITLSAAHRSGRVIIEITDDGAGIDRNRVRQLAEEKGMISPDVAMTDAEIDALLFMPGFSSANEVSELSGRGVGLDVVRSEITALGGRLSVSSEKGQGTTFSISLPLTLAVLEGMVVEVAGQTMVVPITSIRETLHASAAELHTIGADIRVLSVRDTLMPVADLGAMFGFRDEQMDLEDRIFLLIETDTEKSCALIVDALQDQRQVVIKSLETNYCQIDGISAATILGDGRIALIVDPEAIASGIAVPNPVAMPISAPTEGVAHVAI